MSTRTALRPQVVIPSPLGSPVNGASMASNITSAATILQSVSLVSYSISWTSSTAVGAASIQVSNDYALNPNGSVANAGTWTTLPFLLNGSSVTSAPITGASGNGMLEAQTAAYAIRLLYTATSGGGTLSVVVNGKVS